MLLTRRCPGVARAVAALLATAACGACEQSSIADVKPPGGALALEETYNDPPGTLSLDVLPAVAERFASNVELTDATGGLARLDALAGELTAADYGFVSGPEVTDPTENARLLGLARIKYICRGPVGDDVVDEARNGILRVTAKASERGLFPIAWGTMENCSEHEGDFQYTIDGSYYMLLRRAPGGGLDRLTFFRGTIETEAGVYDGALDFRRFAGGGLEIRVPGRGGDVVIGIKDGQTQVLRDKDGEWTCRLQNLRCENDTTGEVLTAEDLGS